MLSYLLSFLLLLAAPPAARPAPAGSIEPCKIFGSVYLETNPSQRNTCFGTVYEEPNDAFADLIVYEETNRLFADQTGLWYPAENREFADYVLYVTTDRSRADFTFHRTKVRSYARCKSSN